MADNLTRLSSIPSRLLEDNSGLKVTPRRGLAEYRSTPGGKAPADQKIARPFGGQTHTPTLQSTFAPKKKTSCALTIYEDPAATEAVAETTEAETKDSMAEIEEETDTCDRDPRRDEETLLETILDGLQRSEQIGLVEEDAVDDDAKTLIFCLDEEDLSIYPIDDDWSDEEEWMEEEEEDQSGVSSYFYSPYGVATNFEEQWKSLAISAHDSDTEVDYVSRC